MKAVQQLTEISDDMTHVRVLNRAIGLMSKVFANGPGDRCSILGLVIPKTQKMAFNTTLRNTQHDKVRIKGNMEQSRERSSALFNTSV